MEEFRGSVQWGVYRSGRNWVVEPKAVTKFSETAAFLTDVEMSVLFAEHFPDMVRAAHSDVCNLAEWIVSRATSG